ncbi:hypothetical protein GGI07_005022 [Coemansia sp. Benny D115]|nr:hypothetical protein GGI07_005022 [Coemansia sp. Benny D115]
MTLNACAELFRSCGLELFTANSPSALHTTATLFRHRLTEAIRSTPTLVGTLTDFIGEILADHDNLSSHLDPLTQPTSGSSESLVRLLLGVDALQPTLIAALLDKFPEFIGDEQGSGSEGETKMSVKILRQMRWLDYIVDSAQLTEKLLETLGFVPPEMQSEIISVLPDIISDSDNTAVSKALAGMLDSQQELTLPILEALGSLDCPQALLQDARNSVLGHLVSAEPMDLPVLINFLLHSLTPTSAQPTIARLRRRLDLDSIVLASRNQKSSRDHSPDVLIFDAIATSLRSHKHLREAWLKIIASDTAEIGPHTTLDLVVLLILHQISTHTKRVEAILRAKIDTVSSDLVAYTPGLVESVIMRFPAVFAAHFTSLLAIASWLIRTSPVGSQGSRVASSLLVPAFGGMGMYQRQEISGELAVHIGSGNQNEIDTATRVVLTLAQKYPWELRPFAIFIKGLLDYVDNLSIEHTRVIFDTLGILSTLATEGQDSMFSDLYIYVRKQLSSVYPKYNRIGIVGTVSLLRQLGTKTADNAGSEDEAGSSTQGPQANLQALRRAVQLLEMLMDSGKHQSWAFISMTYDELAHIVETKGLHPQLLTWLHANVSSNFATLFLAPADVLTERYFLHSVPRAALSLEEDDDGLPVLDILNHNKDAAELLRVAKRPDNDTDDTPPQYVLADTDNDDEDGGNVCSQIVAGDALVGSDEDSRRELLVQLSSLWHPELRRILCSSLYVMVNWVREIINAFADQPTEELHSKVIVRVNQLSKLEKDLLTVAESLIGTGYEFHPVSAGLVPEVSDSAASRTAVSSVGGPAIQIGRMAGSVQEQNDACSQQPSQSPERLAKKQASNSVDIGGLLLSQDDTLKLVNDKSAHQTEGGALGDLGSSKKRGGAKRKNASTQGGSAQGEDFVKNADPYLRELSFSAFGVLAIGTAEDADAQGSLFTVHGLLLVLRELHSVVSTKLVQHTERRVFGGKPAVPYGALATFSSNICGNSAADIVASLMPIVPSLLKYLAGCLAMRALLCKDVDESESLERASEHRGILAETSNPEDIPVLEACVDMLLRTISSVLSWDGLQGEKGVNTMAEFLGILAEAGGQTDREELLAGMETVVLERRAFDYLLGLAPLMGCWGRVADILRMLVTIRGYSPMHETRAEVRCQSSEMRENTMDGRISNLAFRILSGEWADSEETKTGDLEYVITQHIQRYPHSRLELLYSYATETLAGFVGNTLSQSAVGVHAKLQRSTFPIYYKGVINALVLAVKDTSFAHQTASEFLGFAGQVAESWLSLTRLTQSLHPASQSTVLLLSLRGSQSLLDLFLKNLLPALDKHFLLHRDSVLLIFNRIQKSTRILQNICNHSKVAKDSRLQAAVPQVKRKLEQLVFQVVALMENNECRGAINLGNLKHRDVSGHVVGSQIMRQSEDSDEDEGCEEPEPEPEPELDNGMDVDQLGYEAEEQSNRRQRNGNSGVALLKRTEVVKRKRQLIARQKRRTSDGAED